MGKWHVWDDSGPALSYLGWTRERVFAERLRAMGFVVMGW